MKRAYDRTVSTIFLLGAAALVPGANAAAQGFGVYEHSACALGLADAAVARPCRDGSAIYYNPAGIAELAGTNVTLGLSGVRLDGSFTDDATGETTEMDTDLEPVPHLWVTHALSDRLVLGLGAWAPYGLATKWPLAFEGRFVGYDNRLRALYVQPTVAYRIDDRLQVGGGVTVVTGSVELNRRLDLAEMPVPESFGAPPGTTLGALGIPGGTDFADAGLEGDAGVAFGFNVGARWLAHERLSLGARFTSEVDLEYEGDADFTPVPTGITLPPGNAFGAPPGTPLDAVIGSLGLFDPPGPLADQVIATEIAMPAQLQAGVAVGVTPDLTLFADWQWIGWSSFDRVAVDFEQPTTESDVQILDYLDTSALRLAGAYAIDDRLELRVGYTASQDAPPDQSVTPLLSGAPRDVFAAGVGIFLPSGLRVDAGVLLVRQEERAGRVRNPPSGQEATIALNSGVYDVDAMVLGLTAGWRF